MHSIAIDHQQTVTLVISEDHNSSQGAVWYQSSHTLEIPLHCQCEKYFSVYATVYGHVYSKSFIFIQLLRDLLRLCEWEGETTVSLEAWGQGKEQGKIQASSIPLTVRKTALWRYEIEVLMMLTPHSLSGCPTSSIRLGLVANTALAHSLAPPVWVSFPNTKGQLTLLLLLTWAALWGGL